MIACRVLWTVLKYASIGLGRMWRRTSAMADLLLKRRLLVDLGEVLAGTPKKFCGQLEKLSKRNLIFSS
jgi:hypothetical protein